MMMESTHRTVRMFQKRIQPVKIRVIVENSGARGSSAGSPKISGSVSNFLSREFILPHNKLKPLTGAMQCLRWDSNTTKPVSRVSRTKPTGAAPLPVTTCSLPGAAAMKHHDGASHGVGL